MKTAILALLLVLSGCYRDGEQVPGVDDIHGSSYHVQRLFDVDGCNVYRFYDGGLYRYFTSCTGSTMGGNHESAGKTSHYVPEDIRTN